MQDPSPPSISGRILDQTGQPVLGIEITAEPLGLFQAHEGASGRGLIAQARSGLQGAYRFDQLPEGEYRLRTAATQIYLPAETVVRTGVDSADLVVSGEHQLSIQGRVKDSRGNALQGVRVGSVQSSSGDVATDQNGGYRLQIAVTLANRDYFLKFQLAGYREEALRLSETQIYSRGPVQLDATLSALKSLAPVAGRVTNKEGVPFPGKMIQLLGVGHYEAVTNQAGEFIMAEVEANQVYKLWMPAHGPYQPYSKQVEVGPEGLWQDVVIESRLPESGPLSGRMMDASGSPLPRFTLWLYSDNPAAGRFLLITSDDAGRYYVDNVPLGKLTFTTQSSPRLIVSGINLPAGGAENVDLIVDWGGYEASGQIVGPDGTPVPVSRVDLAWSYRYGPVQSSSMRQADADSNGLFRFAQLGPGVHSALVSAQGFRSARVELDIRGNSGPVLVRLERD